jgi:hypothetical protein
MTKDHLNAETAYFLESCAVENRQQEVLFAVTNSFESWRRLVNMTLAKCFTCILLDDNGSPRCRNSLCPGELCS